MEQKITAIRRNRRQEKRWRSVSAPERITWISSGFAQIANIIKWKKQKVIVNLTIMRLSWQWERSRFTIISRWLPVCCMSFLTVMVWARSGGMLTGSASFRDFPHRSGQREPSCTRSLWIVFTMVIRLTMYWRMSTIISRHRAKKWRTGISVRPIFLLESFTAEI